MKNSISILILIATAVASGSAHAMTFGDTCDASAAVAVCGHQFLVAEDEHNVLRLYDLDKPTAPPSKTDVSSFLGEPKESDIEGAAWLGERIYWITSHGRTKKGDLKNNKLHRFFATEVVHSADGIVVRTVGRPYTRLVEALLADHQLDGLGLREAARPDVDSDPELAPKKKGLNIEGLSAAADGKSLLIGFRNPIAEKGAIIVPLLNPREVVDTEATPLFGSPILLELPLGKERLRVRSMDVVHEKSGSAYYIVGGPVGKEGSFALFRWSGEANAKPKLVRSFTNFNPEALFADPTKPGSLVLLSDDGEVGVKASAAECDGDLTGGKCDCKDLKDPKRQSFRAMIVTP